MNRSVLSFKLLTAILVVLFSLTALAAEAPGSDAETNALELMRSYVQLQEQVHQAQLAIEATRKEAREASLITAQTLTTQLKGIEGALASQRARELEAMQSSNRVMLIMAGSFAALGFAAMILMAYFQWRTVHSLAEISAVLPSARAMGSGRSVAVLGPGELPPPSAVAEESSERLLGALEQLEKRILGLERAQRPALVAENPEAPHNGNGDSGERDEGATPERSGETAPAESEAKLLASGQALLDQENPVAALVDFEKVLALDPGHAEALVKKGSALERLGQLDQAVECYDQAIASNGSLTVAYLHKGGLFNRMERFSEALDCYEKALRTQENRAG